MIKIKFRGFTLVEVIVSIAYFSIVASSIYLMSSYLVSSSKFITKDYASRISYMSYMERLKLKQINDELSDEISSFAGKLIFKIENNVTPNSNIYKITLKPKKHKKNKLFETYWIP